MKRKSRQRRGLKRRRRRRKQSSANLYHPSPFSLLFFLHLLVCLPYVIFPHIRLPLNSLPLPFPPFTRLPFYLPILVLPPSSSPLLFRSRLLPSSLILFSFFVLTFVLPVCFASSSSPFSPSSFPLSVTGGPKCCIMLASEIEMTLVPVTDYEAW